MIGPQEIELVEAVLLHNSHLEALTTNFSDDCVHGIVAHRDKLRTLNFLDWAFLSLIGRFFSLLRIGELSRGGLFVASFPRGLL